MLSNCFLLLYLEKINTSFIFKKAKISRQPRQNSGEDHHHQQKTPNKITERSRGTLRKKVVSGKSIKARFQEEGPA